jgi:hypothetical protein
MGYFGRKAIAPTAIRDGWAAPEFRQSADDATAPDAPRSSR